MELLNSYIGDVVTFMAVANVDTPNAEEMQEISPSFIKETLARAVASGRREPFRVNKLTYVANIPRGCVEELQRLLPNLEMHTDFPEYGLPHNGSAHGFFRRSDPNMYILKSEDWEEAATTEADLGIESSNKAAMDGMHTADAYMFAGSWVAAQIVFTVDIVDLVDALRVTRLHRPASGPTQSLLEAVRKRAEVLYPLSLQALEGRVSGY